MDPQTTWEEMLASHGVGRSDDARQSAADLLDWLRRGGFAPITLEGVTRDDPLHRVVAMAVCRSLLMDVR